MEASPKPYVWQQVQEGAHKLGRVPVKKLRDWVVNRYQTKSTTASLHITQRTVNHPKRVNWPMNQRTRLANDPVYDLLYQHMDGTIEPYNPEVHGMWQIREGRPGEWVVERVKGGATI